MEIKKIEKDKKRFLDLLLLADEQEDMIHRYLDSGDMYALYDGDLKSVCVILQTGEYTYEIKNLATDPKYHRLGYAKKLIKYIFSEYGNYGVSIYVGTGDVPSVLTFYQKCGFEFSHRIPNFFTDNYDHPIYEEGVLLTDMVYLKKTFQSHYNPLLAANIFLYGEITLLLMDKQTF